MPGSAAAKLAALELVTIDGVLTDALQVFAEPRPIGGCQTTAAIENLARWPPLASCLACPLGGFAYAQAWV